MDLIASITKNKKTSIQNSVFMREREIAIVPYYWGLRKRHVIRRVSAQGIRIAALDQALYVKNRPSLPFYTANGKLLKIALLPRVLDNLNPLWREETIAVNCDTKAGFMSALILAQETRSLQITGSRAAETKDHLFREYGFLTSGEPGVISLDKIGLPRTISINRDLLPIEVGEALLFAVATVPPTLNPDYLFALARRALYYGIELPKFTD